MKSQLHRLREIPAVDTILNAPDLAPLLKARPRWLVVDAVHAVLASLRQDIQAGQDLAAGEMALAKLIPRVEQAAEEMGRYHLRPVVNATGVVIHTNLGRAVLPEEVLHQVVRVASHYSNLEYDLSKGARGTRYAHVEDVLCRLCGSEAALVVNNNAGAVLLGLNTLAEGREVIVSRGQLVEIGGSFRIPDVMKKSGCHLVEVGTTNKTHPKDYRNAIGEQTAALLKVHMSNFEMSGFTREVSRREMVAIAREAGLPLMEDLGSGNLVDLSAFGLPSEPTVQESVRDGVDLVTFSGDKLLGGPQAGILVGKKNILDRVKKNPMTRALRVDKMTLAALEVIARIYLDPPAAQRQIPTLRMLSTPLSELKARAQTLARRIRSLSDNTLVVDMMEDLSRVGGGALPETPLPTCVISLSTSRMSVNGLEQAFRAADPPVIGRIRHDRFLLDVRTIQDPELETVARVAGEVAALSS
jgi:L-seryl-tRNA(Ser) seleniumtransferase